MCAWHFRYVFPDIPLCLKPYFIVQLNYKDSVNRTVVQTSQFDSWAAGVVESWLTIFLLGTILVSISKST